MILAVETSSRSFSLSLSGEVRGSLELERKMTHSQHIVSAVRFVCRQLGVRLADIHHLYAGVGPGSFTGIRIGLSFANTVGQLFDIPLTGVPWLDTLAYEIGRWYNSVVPFIRSRKDEVYTAYYEGGARVTDFTVLRSEEFRRFLSERRPERIVASRDSLADMLGDEWADRQCASIPRAGVMIDLVRETGKKPEGGYLKPLYVRGFA
jgi:tRNA threonylcarbamoyl adenosine modification protein YeaZ